MMSRLRGSLAIAAIAVASACGSQPVSPSTTITARTIPTISGLSISSLVAGSSAQTITVSGTNFAAGLTVTVSPTIGPVTVANVTPTSFQLTGTFTAAGSYTLSVSVNDLSSNAVTLSVSPPVPTISSLSLASIVASNSPQSIVVSGSNFTSGMTVTVSPNIGAVTATNVTPTSFQLTGTFSSAGAYTVSVSVNGQASNAEPLTVTSPPPEPAGQYLLRLTLVEGQQLSGPHAGTVTGPDGFACTFGLSAGDGACSQYFRAGTSIQLKATLAWPYFPPNVTPPDDDPISFTTGCDAQIGQDTCVVNLTTDRNVTIGIGRAVAAVLVASLTASARRSSSTLETALPPFRHTSRTAMPVQARRRSGMRP